MIAKGVVNGIEITAGAINFDFIGFQIFVIYPFVRKIEIRYVVSPKIGY